MTVTDDEQMAHDVKVAALKLNDAIDAAARRHLRVELTVYDTQLVSERWPTSHVDPSVSRPL
jgi:hypothetical protein